jgi:AraC-like DNA-binding protein
MKYLEYLPPPELAPFIKCYWSLSDFSIVPHGHENQFLTEGGIELVFNLGDPFFVSNIHSTSKKHTDAFAIGAMTKAQWGYTGGKCHLFGVCFLPGGALPFLPVFPLECTDRCIDVGDFEDSELRMLTECLQNELRGVQSRIDIFNRYFCRKLDRPSLEYKLLRRAIQMIRQSHGQIPIEMLAQRLCINRRRLERLFLKMVGISPKRMSRIFRIKNAIGHMMSCSFDGWVDLALSTGYYDQAHFIREFKMVTNLSPSYCKDSGKNLAMLGTIKPTGLERADNVGGY